MMNKLNKRSAPELYFLESKEEVVSHYLSRSKDKFEVIKNILDTDSNMDPVMRQGAVDQLDELSMIIGKMSLLVNVDDFKSLIESNE